MLIWSAIQHVTCSTHLCLEFLYQIRLFVGSVFRYSVFSSIISYIDNDVDGEHDHIDVNNGWNYGGDVDGCDDVENDKLVAVDSVKDEY